MGGGEGLKLFTCHFSPQNSFTSQAFSVFPCGCKKEAHADDLWQVIDGKDSCGHKGGHSPWVPKASGQLASQTERLGHWRSPGRGGARFPYHPWAVVVSLTRPVGVTWPHSRWSLGTFSLLPLPSVWFPEFPRDHDWASWSLYSWTE